MKKILTVSVWLIGMMLQSSFAEEPKLDSFDKLARKAVAQAEAVSGNGYSFGDIVRIAAAQTGCQIVCPPELMDLANQREIKIGGTWTKQVAKEEWIKNFNGYYKVKCTEGAQDRTLVLDVGWKTDAPASAAELLERLWHHPGKFMMGTFDETTFNALLSKKCNYTKAWKVRQMSFLSKMFVMGATLPPRLVEKIISRDGREYVLVITVQEIEVSPGHGSMAWYLFDSKGVLVSADLVNTGHRCWFKSAAMHGDGELQMVLNFGNDEKYGVNVTYAVEDDQLKPVQAINFDGNVEKLDFLHIGQSLMPK